MAFVLKDSNRKLNLSGQSPTGECAYGTNLKRLRKKSWRTANTTTAAEAELILKPLRGAEAPLFHVAHAYVNFSTTSEVVPFPIFICYRDECRNSRTIVVMSFSWKRRMAAMPAAPA